jgi:hypothetical protein
MTASRLELGVQGDPTPDRSMNAAHRSNASKQNKNGSKQKQPAEMTQRAVEFYSSTVAAISWWRC